MKVENRRKIRILYVETIEIRLLDIPRALDKLEYDVYRSTLDIKAQSYEEEKKNELTAAIDNLDIHMAVSYNFVPTVAQACMETGIPYISWVYDAPQQELYTHYALYPCSYIFAFDKEQVRRVKGIGAEHIYHMPLSVLGDKVQAVKLKQKQKIIYQDEVSFVGQLYYIENNKQCIQNANQQIQNAFEKTIEKNMTRWYPKESIHGTLPEICRKYFAEVSKHNSHMYAPLMEESFFYEAAVLSRELANRERNLILNTLSQKYRVSLYTYDKNTSQLNQNVTVKSAVSWDCDMYGVFHSSKINLNITLHCIETGIPQRVFDVMAAGGFLLTNYQEEIEEQFIPGEDLAVYHNLDELEELTAYYLEHEEERERIAKNGQKKVLKFHEMTNKLDNMIDIVVEAEKNRNMSYMQMQRDFLRKEANRFLLEKTGSESLEALFLDRKYETVIGRTNDLGILREMLEIQRNGTNENYLTEFSNLNELEERYLHIKHILWRIEQGMSSEKCIEGVQELVELHVPKKWIIFSAYHNLDKRVDTIEKLGEYMVQCGYEGEALELFSYAAIFHPEEPRFLLDKAGCLMDLQFWHEALLVLRQIEKPDVEVKEMIEELESTLGGGKE